jgi:cardiolipin synthase
MIASKQSDVFFMPWVHSAFHQALVKTGIKIFSFAPAVLHAKYMLIDDWGMVGSSNLNQRSFLHDLEADVIVEQEQDSDRIGQRVREGSKAVKTTGNRGDIGFAIWQRACGRFALLFKRFL